MMSEFNGRGGSRGGASRGNTNRRGLGRGGRRGGFTGGFGGSAPGCSRPLTPERKSDDGFDRRQQREMGTFRNGREFQSRSPSPDRRSVVRNPFEGRWAHDERDEQRRSRTPPRQEFQRPTTSRQENQVRGGFQSSFPSDTGHDTEKMTPGELARYWKVKLADIEEAVRRAEFNLRRAQIDKENALDAYAEYIKSLKMQSQ